MPVTPRQAKAATKTAVKTTATKAAPAKTATKAAAKTAVRKTATKAAPVKTAVKKTTARKTATR